MAEYDNAVNEIISRYSTSLQRRGDDNPNRERWSRDMDAIVALKEEVERLRAITKPVSNALGDISDIPEELQAELSAIKTDALEDQIFTVINAAGGKANIDTILVELFRKFGVLQKRRFLTNKLWRMVNNDGLLWGAKEKGVYLSKDPNIEPETDDDGFDISLDDDFEF